MTGMSRCLCPKQQDHAIFVRLGIETITLIGEVQRVQKNGGRSPLKDGGEPNAVGLSARRDTRLGAGKKDQSPPRRF